jgi:hypothetical protein
VLLLSEEKTLEIIRSAYTALLSGDIDGMLSHCTNDVTLNWGPFTFEGRSELRRWAEELREMFPTMRIRETKLMVQGSKASHDFLILFRAPNGQQGRLEIRAEYTLKNQQIQYIQTTLSLGVLTFEKEEIEHLGLPRRRL